MNETSKKLIKTFGNKAEILKAMSELGELQAALGEYLYCVETMDDRSAGMALDDVFEEMGDVRLTLNTLAHIFGTENFQASLKASIEKANSHIRLKEVEDLEKEGPSRYAKGRGV